MTCIRRKCKLDPDVFCYICGSFATPKQRTTITDFVQKVYHAYFGIKLGDQNKPWAFPGLILGPNLPSAIKPVPHSDEVPVPEFTTLDGPEEDVDQGSSDRNVEEEIADGRLGYVMTDLVLLLCPDILTVQK
jgi:hypothetical protein